MIRYAPAPVDVVPAPKARTQEVMQPAVKTASVGKAPVKATAVAQEQPASVATKPAAEPLVLSGEEAPKTRKARKASSAGKRGAASKRPEAEPSLPLL